jgi:hypothetical protein
VFHSRTVATELSPTGHNVLVDPWDNWPGRRLSPMPNLITHKPAMSSVDVSLNAWPGADELPLPELAADSAPEQDAQALTQPPVQRPRNAAASHDLASEPDDSPLEVLGIFEAAPFDSWPAIDALPLPAQVAVAAAVASQPQQEEASPTDGGPAPETGVPPEVLVGAVLLTVIAGIFGASRRGRMMLIGVGKRLRLSPFMRRLW